MLVYVSLWLTFFYVTCAAFEVDTLIGQLTGFQVVLRVAHRKRLDEKATGPFVTSVEYLTKHDRPLQLYTSSKRTIPLKHAARHVQNNVIWLLFLQVEDKMQVIDLNNV